MEFSSRGFQRNNARPATASAGGATGSPESNNSGGPSHKKAFHKLKASRLNSALGIILSVSLLILVVAIIIGVSTRSSEDSYINSKEYQAVFLQGGQVYFGKVKSLNDTYMNLTDVYYLNVNDQSVQPENQSSQQNLSLVKLGCELHGPKDQMIINRDQITFWENLKDDSRVVTAIKDWQSQNKDGQKCEQQSATQQQSSSQSNNSSSSSNSTVNSSNNTATQNSGSSSTTGTSQTPATTPTDSSNTSTQPGQTPTP